MGTTIGAGHGSLQSVQGRGFGWPQEDRAHGGGFQEDGHHATTEAGHIDERGHMIWTVVCLLSLIGYKTVLVVVRNKCVVQWNAYSWLVCISMCLASWFIQQRLVYLITCWTFEHRIQIAIFDLVFHNTEMPFFRKFQIERKNFKKNKTVSLDKNNRSKKGGKGLEKRKIYQNSVIKNRNGNLFHTFIVFSQVF